MELTDIIEKRRSIRDFRDIPIPNEILEKILNYALLAPSGRNAKPVDLIVLKDKETITKVMNARTNNFGFLKTAPVCIVVTADEESSTWCADASIVASYIQLLAVNYSLGSCWGQVHGRYFNDKSVEEEIKRILSIPENFRVLSIVSLGYANEEKAPHTLNEVNKSKIHYDHW